MWKASGTDKDSEPSELWEVSRRADGSETVRGSKKAVGRRKRTTAEACAGVGWVDKRWERHPDEKECSGGADVEVFRLWKADTRDAGRICAGNIRVWWWESGGEMEIKTNITFLILNIFERYGIILNVITNIPRIRGWKNETVKNIYTEYATF